MGGSSGGGGGQQIIQSGPSLQASQLAAQAQIGAAQAAAQAATQNTQSAIQALMGEYGNSVALAQPTINLGGQAAGQLNYILGLNPQGLPTAPTAPTAPTLDQARSGISDADINNYITMNTKQTMNPSGFLFDQYTGAGANQNLGLTPIGLEANSGDFAPYSINAADPNLQRDPTGFFRGQSGVQDAVRAQLAQDQLNNPNSAINQQFANQQDVYQQALNTYNNQLPIAQYYQNLGKATPQDISGIITTLPGFQFAQQQGIQGIQNAASASGNLNSGNLLQQLDQYGQGLSQQYYQNYINNLAQQAGLGVQAQTGASNGANAVGSNIAGLQSNLGTTQANSLLSQGQAQASSYLNPLRNQDTNVYSSGGGGNGMGAAGLGLLGSLGSSAISAGLFG